MHQEGLSRYSNAKATINPVPLRKTGQAAVDEVRPYQPELVLADTGHNGIVLSCAIWREQVFAELMFVRPLLGFLLKRSQYSLIPAAAKGLLDTVLAVGLGHDLY